MRGDIQGLRALAVTLVVLWHAGWSAVSAGFVGVDVFFVISGYLMTGLLVREMESQPSHRPRLLRFFARRAQRLLPAAGVVLIASAALAAAALPWTRWESEGITIASAAAYVVNWRLATTSTDYLAGSDPSLVQHYWSLAVEEQFYLLFPVLLALGAAGPLLRRVGPRGVAWAVVLLLLVPSLLASVLLSEPGGTGVSYFGTHLRLWEFALGGVVALLPATAAGRHLGPVRIAGLLAIGWSAVALPADLAFPGWIAVVPTLGTALILWAGHGRPAGPGPFPRWQRPVIGLGDVSYSLYLWHWPLLVALPLLLEGTPAVTWLAVGLALVLAVLTERWVERPLRAPRTGVRRATHHAGPRARTRWTASATVAALLAGSALALAPAVVADPSIRPFPADATEDRYRSFYDGPCRTAGNDTAVRACTGGDPDAERRIVLTGDSLAVMWMPALSAAGAERGWRVDLVAKLSCPVASTTVLLDDAPFSACRDWNAALLRDLAADPPDRVLVVNSDYDVAPDAVPPGLDPADALRETTARSLSSLRDAGADVSVFGPSPRLPEPVPDCLAALPDPDDPDSERACGADTADVVAPTSALVEAARGLGLPVASPADVLCPDGFCPAVTEDRLLVYMDPIHITATYAATLGEPLADLIGLDPAR